MGVVPPTISSAAGRRAGVVLAGLTLLALGLRVWALGSMPPGLDTDEAAIGYNAYSLLRSGRDEYGEPWPFLFQSFGEWKRPVYIYAAPCRRSPRWG